MTDADTGFESIEEEGEEVDDEEEADDDDDDVEEAAVGGEDDAILFGVCNIAFVDLSSAFKIFCNFALTAASEITASLLFVVDSATDACCAFAPTFWPEFPAFAPAFVDDEMLRFNSLYLMIVLLSLTNS
jgi:hypothetical protein